MDETLEDGKRAMIGIIYVDDEERKRREKKEKEERKEKDGQNEK